VSHQDDNAPPATAQTASALSRRAFVGLAGAAGLGLAAGCGGGLKGSTNSSTGTIKIGYISPQTGVDAAFATAEPFVISKVRQALSKGMSQKVQFIATVVARPELVLLDEPSEGVAPLIVEQMANTIGELKQEGLSVLLSEQNIHFAALVADRAYVLEKGQVQWQGAMAELMRDTAAQRALLSM